jgi:hypothetical protein
LPSGFLLRFRKPEPRDPKNPADPGPHATLILERSTGFPVSGNTHSIPPFALQIPGDEAFRQLTFTQTLPREFQWDQSAWTERWTVRIEVPEKSVASAWERAVVKPLRDAVRLVNAGRPITTAPSLLPEKTPVPVPANPWTAWFTFVDFTGKGKLDKADFSGTTLGTGFTLNAAGVTLVARRLTRLLSVPRDARLAPSFPLVLCPPSATAAQPPRSSPPSPSSMLFRFRVNSPSTRRKRAASSSNQPKCGLRSLSRSRKTSWSGLARWTCFSCPIKTARTRAGLHRPRPFRVSNRVRAAPSML